MDKQKKRFDRAVELIQKYSKADDYHILWYSEDSSLTRFADNMVTQNVSSETETIYLESCFGTKKATISTSQLDEESIKGFVKKCEQAAKQSVDDKEHMPTVGHTEQEIIHQIDPEIQAMDENERAAIVENTLLRANKEKVIASGIVSNGMNYLGIATANGANKFFGKTFVNYSNTVNMNGENGASAQDGVMMRQIDPQKALDDAISDAKILQQRISIDPGRYTVLLSASASNQLLSNMSYYGMNRRAVDEGYSPYTGKLDTKLVDSRVNIYSNPSDELLPARPFDFEGSNIEKRSLFEEGVLKNIPCSRWWAKEKGHTPWNMGNLIFPGTDTDDEKLIAKIERGFYIKELWYIRMVKMEDLTLTGMTRNGFFYIEDGMIVSGATHFRWNNSPITLLNNIIEIGKGKSKYPEWGVPINIPSLLLNDFYLSSKTRF